MHGGGDGGVVGGGGGKEQNYPNIDQIALSITAKIICAFFDKISGVRNVFGVETDLEDNNSELPYTDIIL